MPGVGCCPQTRGRPPIGPRCAVAPNGPAARYCRRGSPSAAETKLLRPGQPSGRSRPHRLSAGPPIGVRGTPGGSSGGGRGLSGGRNRSRRSLASRPDATQPDDVRPPRTPLRLPHLRPPHLCERRVRRSRTGRRRPAASGRASRGTRGHAPASRTSRRGGARAPHPRPGPPRPGPRPDAGSRRTQPSARVPPPPSARGRGSSRPDPDGTPGRNQPGAGSPLSLLRGREPLGLGLSKRGTHRETELMRPFGYGPPGPGARIASTTSRPSPSLRIPWGTPSGATSIRPGSIGSSRSSSRKTPRPCRTW